jgi:cell division protein FtsL
MAETTRARNERDINAKRSQYNNVRRENVSISGMASTAAGILGDAVAERNRRIARERANAPIIVKKRVKSGPFPVSFVFYTLVMTVMLMFVVYGNSVVNEISYEISGLESEIAATKQENADLTIELDRKYDLKYIENVAINELGLVKSTDVVKHYVSISGGDKVVVSEQEAKKTAGRFDATLDSLKESVAKIYE